MSGVLDPVLRVGTRGSRLSLRQTEIVRDAVRYLGRAFVFEVVIVRTAGDRAPEAPLERLEDIGFFAKDLEAALVDGRCDLAVHSAKDLPTTLHPDLCIAAFLPREDPRDVLISRSGLRLGDLPAGARIGTSSLRRIAQLLHYRPDLQAMPMRGNIDTRLEKLERGGYDALCLAGAGLVRLGWQDRITEWLEPEIMLPAPAQGALAVEVRRTHHDLIEFLKPVDSEPAREAVTAERAFIARLGSGCRKPAAALATVNERHVILEGLVAREDGTAVRRVRASGPIGAPEWLGMSAADHMLAQSGDLLDAGGSLERAVLVADRPRRS